MVTFSMVPDYQHWLTMVVLLLVWREPECT